MNEIEQNIQIVEKILADTSDVSTEELLACAIERFGDKVALASSMSCEDQVVTDIYCGLTSTPRIFTLDTGRLPQETYDVIDATNQRYNLKIKMLFPDRQQVQEMVNQSGPNSFYESIEARKRCCDIRKVQPLRKELATLDAWMTGLRREQSVTRQELQRVQWDSGNGLIKFNPLADWTAEQVWQYIREHDLPYNKLHDQGYPSIGCAPCTRPVAQGEDPRSGRWWWEQPEQKECGLHVVDGKLLRKEKQ